MKTLIISTARALLLVSALAFGQGPAAPPSTDDLPLTGVWRGQMNNLPTITLTITDEGGSLSGAVLFYLMKREDVNQPFTATAGNPEPILNPKFDGKTLTFQVSHRRAHPPRTMNDPPVPFHLTLTGPNKGALVKEDEGTGPGLPMVRSDY